MASPTFGAPCPAVIYTFGLLLLAPAVPLRLLIIPTLWALIGTSAPLAFGIVQDGGLLVSAAVPSRCFAPSDTAQARLPTTSRTENAAAGSGSGHPK